MSVLVTVAIALAALSLAFAALYGWSRAIDNYGTVDVLWSLAFAGVTAFFAAVGSGWEPRRLVLAVVVGLWSIRLGTHLWRRVASHHPVEDARYRQLRHDWAANFGPRMFGFFQMQAASVVFLAVPFLLIAQHDQPTWHPLEIAALALWVLAWLGEATADYQLAAFKRDPANRQRVCDRGLWRYSRHPNYFFEWLIWVAYALAALPAPYGWVAIVAPATMLYLLLRVTGVPLAEQQSLRSKGDAYRRYQATTSAFFPWFRQTSP